MVKNSGLYPAVGVECGDVPAVGLAGARLLTETIRVTSLGNELSRALSAWRRSWAVHDPGKIMADLAVCVALGGRCLSDVALLRCQGEVFGPVASDPTVCRLVGTLADHVEAVEAAVNRARTVVRQRAWALAGADAPTAGISAAHPLVIDVDATLVNVHSDKEGAAPTFKKGFGYHPLTAWIDHGTGQGGGECAVIMLRPGNAGSNTAADHVEIIRRALDQAGLGPRPGRRVLVRIDGAGGTKETIELLARRRVSYSVGFTLPDHTPQIYDTIPEAAWTPAYNTDGEPRQGADVAEITDLLDLTAWPKGMRVIMRRERPHQGAQLRFEDVGGYRLTAFATNTKVGQLADLEVRHRLRARCEDRIRCAKDTGLDRFPLQGFDQNRIWCLIVALARRPAGLLPAARPGRRPRPRLGAPDDPVAADGHPRRHRPPRPPHRPALQGRPPLDRPPACRARAPPGTPRPVDTRNSSPARHDPEGPPWPLERPDHRETTRGRPPHPTGIINPTTPATTPPKPTQPDHERSRLVTGEGAASRIRLVRFSP